jgi:hypothetical protein
MCENQKIVSTRYSSFNVLGLSLILILGALIIILDMALEPCVARWATRKYTKRLSSMQDEEFESETHPLYSVVEWSQTGTLQLQRLAHEEAGFGTWSQCAGDVPVTEPGQLIAGLDLRDAKHPMLIQQKVTPVSAWSEVVPYKTWGMRRSDTGMDTLVEEGEKEKKVDLEVDPMPMFHAIGEREAEREHGLGVQVQDGAGEEAPGDWRALR